MFTERVNDAKHWSTAVEGHQKCFISQFILIVVSYLIEDFDCSLCYKNVDSFGAEPERF